LGVARLNIIYRDLKPENILLDADGPNLNAIDVLSLSNKSQGKKGTRMIQSLIRDPLILEIKGFQNSKSAK